jgi:cell division transport system permease protein
MWGEDWGKSARSNLLYLVEFKPEIEVKNVLEMKTRLASAKEFESLEYISAERAQALLESDLLVEPGLEDDLTISLPSYLAVRISDWGYEEVTVDSILHQLRAYPEVEGVYAQPEILDQLGENLAFLGKILLGLTLLFLIFSILLLSHIIKLDLYSSRTEIKTMQLTGVAPSYIRRPFLRRYVSLTILAWIIASIGLLSINNYGLGYNLLQPDKLLLTGAIFGIMLLTGVLVSLIITFNMVNKYIFADIASLF